MLLGASLMTEGPCLCGDDRLGFSTGARLTRAMDARREALFPTRHSLPKSLLETRIKQKNQECSSCSSLFCLDPFILIFLEMQMH